MNKLRVLAQKCAALLLLLHCLVATGVHLFREKVQHQCISLSSMVRRISPLKMPFNSLVKCNSSNTSPNFAQEKSNLREWRENLPVDEHFPDSWEHGDEFDHEDYDEWYEDNYGSWEQQAVDEAIAEEDDELPPIPF